MIHDEKCGLSGKNAIAKNLCFLIEQQVEQRGRKRQPGRDYVIRHVAVATKAEFRRGWVGIPDKPRD